VKKLSINMAAQNQNIMNSNYVTNSAKDQKLERNIKIASQASKNRTPISYNNTFYQPDGNKGKKSPKNLIKYL